MEQPPQFDQKPQSSDGWGGKMPPCQFFPVTSTTEGISTQNVLTFSFNPFATLV